MTTNDGAPMLEAPSLLEAAWKNRVLVGGMTLLFTALGLLIPVFRGESYTADAAVVIDVPAAVSAGDTDVPISADRQVANQLEVMRSRLVAERASELAAAQGVEASSRQIISNSFISSIRESDVIEISFNADSPEVAEVVTGSIIAAYQDVRRQQRLDEVSTVLTQLEATELALFSEFTEVSDRLTEQLSARALEARVALVLDEISAKQLQVSATGDPATRAGLLGEIEELDRQLRTLELALRIELEQPEVASLLSERADIEGRLAAIQQLRIQVEADSAAEGSGLAFLSAPSVDSSGGAVLAIVGALAGGLLGLVLGLGAAYALSVSRRSFELPEEPQGVLGVPYLSDIPTFKEVGSDGPLPVLSDPRSPAAEAFRFVAASLLFRASRADAKIVVVVSSSVGDGKSTIVANTALAAARAGKRVLLIDADFGNQATSRVLLGDISLGKGLSELVTGRANLSDVVNRVEAGPDVTLDLISRGTAPTIAPDLFAQQNTAVAMRRLADEYDLVFLDPPPLLQVAYASNIVQMADAAVIVVSHGNKIRAAEDLRARLDLIESDVLGYVYNRAPLRLDMMESGGSMKDVLGDSGLVDPVQPRRI